MYWLLVPLGMRKRPPGFRAIKMLGVAKEAPVKYSQKVHRRRRKRPPNRRVACNMRRLSGWSRRRLVFGVLHQNNHPGAKKTPGENLPGEETITSLKQSWGPRERQVIPQPLFQNVLEKAKLKDERKKKPATPTWFEARGGSLRSNSTENITELHASASGRMPLKDGATHQEPWVSKEAPSQPCRVSTLSGDVKEKVYFPALPINLVDADMYTINTRARAFIS